MIFSLYPVVIDTLAAEIPSSYPNMITSLYPVPVELVAAYPYIPNMIASLYPVPVEILYTPVPVSYLMPPNLDGLELINDGKEGFAAMYANMYVIAYSSKVAPSDIIGNISTTGVHWTPAENNTDPPSHFVLANKDLSYDCTFYPVFDEFSGMFAMAWIENNAVGRLNLKYANVAKANPVAPPITTGTTATSGSATINAINQTIFVRPDIQNTRNNEVKENIPLNDVAIRDIDGNTFYLNAFIKNARPYGYEMNLPQKIQAITFSQNFRVRKTLQCLISTAPKAATEIAEYIPPLPLSGIQINVYKGQTKNLFKTFYSDVNGKFQVPVGIGSYTFEIIVDSPSINFSQIFV